MALARMVFITGTDTGVGKTTVGCALLAAYRRAGRSVEALKPIETGCARGAAGLLAADALRLAAAAGSTIAPDFLCPNRYELPVSPEAAATATGRPVDRAAILSATASRRQGHDLLVIEGAGGLLVPIAPGFLMADLVHALGAPVLIVARAALGTVNHSLLTIDAARARGLRIAGVILNHASPAAGPDKETNAEAIARHGRVTVFGSLPFAGDASFETLCENAASAIDLEGLYQAL